jgi:phospholipid/cholesterol/gamma-HCH transport system ATP-binding protein
MNQHPSSEILSEARGLCFGYVPDQLLLNGVELEIRRGDVIIISGESGQGKSTLLRLLVGLELPVPNDSGTEMGQVFLFGEDIHDIPRSRLLQLRQRTGYVFQNNALVSNMSVRENIAMPLRYHTHLTDAEIDARVTRLVDGLLLTGHDDKRPAMLSLGMQKRAAVARAMAMEPEILFLDEPTAGLDARNNEVMLSLIGNLRALSNVAILMVTHDLSGSRLLGGRIALLLDGRLRSPRTLQQLMDSHDSREREILRESEVGVPRA